MEHLTKQQVTLLCLLVALFTSVATSVITASLVDDSYGSVTQTIYRVVEKTIQEVAPKDSAVARKIVEKEKENVGDVPKTSEQIPLSQIVEKANQSLVSVLSRNGGYLSAGAIVGDKNAVIVFNGVNIFKDTTYFVRLADQKMVEMRKQPNVLGDGFALLTYTENAKETPKLTGLSLGSIETEKLGSNVIALGAKEQGNVVSTGIITEFVLTGTASTSAPKTHVITDIRLSMPSSGWMLLNTSGRLIGLLSGIPADNKGTRYVDAEKIRLIAQTLF